ncbi:hydrolase-like protein (plasmid) [Rhizobium gallicum]|uniref:Hydrolase-like protein n=1 Tax=Rhizobium gallicum TaxID=56730 RepID=A0A1L5NXX4_9HYPH|nr:hydrolase-like protein [Rhizobium gallicum]
MNNLIDLAKHIPTPEAILTVAYTPIRLPMVDRQPLELRLTAPATGGNLPIVLLSHGFGPSNYIPSKDGYAPTNPVLGGKGFRGDPADACEFARWWLAFRFTRRAVLLARARRGDKGDSQPVTRSRTPGALRCGPDGSFAHRRGRPFLRRAHRRLLLGAQLNGEDFSDLRISAGILLAAPGRRGKDMTEENAARFPLFDVDLSTLTTRSLVVCGDSDDPHFTTRGPEWHGDAFHDALGAKALLMLHGVGHGLGGIAGLDAKETETEAPDALEATKRLTLAWLQTVLRADEGAWPSACPALEGKGAACGCHAKAALNLVKLMGGQVALANRPLVAYQTNGLIAARVLSKRPSASALRMKSTPSIRVSRGVGVCWKGATT